EGDRRVTPVVHTVQRRVLRVVLKHRQELDSGDAKALEIRDLLDQSGVGAARGLRHARARMARETAHVHLVDDRSRGRTAEWRVFFPIVRGWIDDDALHRGRRVVAVTRRPGSTVAARYGHAASVRIEQDLHRIEAMAVLRIGWAPNAVGVELPGSDTWKERV